MGKRSSGATKGLWVAWITLLMIAVVFAEGVTFSLQVHGRHMREKDYRTYLTKAIAFLSQNSYADALVQAEEAIRRAPERPEPYIMAGHVHYRLKNWERAISAYETAVAKGSEDEGARLNTTWALVELKRYDDAIAEAKKAMAAGFTSATFPRYLAEACWRAGRIADAIPFLEQSLNGFPNDLYLLDHLRQGYAAINQPAKAAEVQAKATDIEASLHMGGK
ncbi:MAG: tetratricopeptide repeat protein [Candidatus Hydrogenedentes bacterium]|nr:tetratricopeptide repeat protein [Candidatus Hydrogenedentota bacterium]